MKNVTQSYISVGLYTFIETSLAFMCISMEAENHKKGELRIEESIS